MRPRSPAHGAGVAVIVILAGAAVAFLVARGPSPGARPQSWGVPDPDTTRMQHQVADLLWEARQAVLREPDSPEAWGRLGEVCDAHELYAYAAPCYQRASALAPNNFRWPYLLASVRQAQGAGGDEVAALLRRASRLEPDLPLLFVELGDALARHGQAPEACDAYREAIELDPKLAAAQRGLGQALIALGDPRAALDALEEALQVGPQDAAVYAAMAQACTQLGDLEGAEQATQRSRELPIVRPEPGPVRAEVLSLGISALHCYYRAGRLMEAGDYAEAINQLKIAEEYAPDDPALQQRLGISYTQTDQDALAIQHLSKAVRLKDTLYSAHAALGSLFAARGDLDRAVAHYRRALGHVPNEGHLRAALAVALARGGDLEEAIGEFERAAALAPLGPGAHYHWGLALEELGRLDEAIEQYQRAVESDANHPAARRLARLQASGP